MNLIISLIFIVLGVYFIYDTNRKPSVLLSTDMKGYIAGIGFVIIGLLSIFGQFSLFEVLKKIVKAIIK